MYIFVYISFLFLKSLFFFIFFLFFASSLSLSLNLSLLSAANIRKRVPSLFRLSLHLRKLSINLFDRNIIKTSIRNRRRRWVSGNISVEIRRLSFVSSPLVFIYRTVFDENGKSVGVFLICLWYNLMIWLGLTMMIN